MRARWMKHGRPRGPLGFQTLVALHTTVDVEDGFAVFPDQFDTIDAAIALIQEGHIVDVAIGLRDPYKPQSPLAPAEHGEKLFACRRYYRHAPQPPEYGGQ